MEAVRLVSIPLARLENKVFPNTKLKPKSFENPNTNINPSYHMSYTSVG